MFKSFNIAPLILSLLFFCVPTGQELLAETGDAVTVVDADGHKVHITDRSRIVSLGGPVTEIVCALGYADNIVATDISSTWPESLENLPKVGYWRALATEGILSFNPTLIIISDLAGPEYIFDQLRATGIPVLRVPEEFSIPGAKHKITLLAAALNRKERGEALISTLDRDLAHARELLKDATTRRKALMLYLRGAKVLNAGGADTPIDFMLNWCMSDNVVHDIDGWKPVGAEAIIGRSPDVLVLTTSGLASVGGTEGLLNIPGIAQTPAGRNANFVVIDDLLLLGFGPRLGKAMIELVRGLHFGDAEAGR